MYDNVIIVHSVSDIVTALRTAQKLGINVTLQTSETAVNYLGVPYIKEMVETACQAFDLLPEHQFICDAGDNPAIVQELVHAGFRLIRFKGQQEVKEKLLSIVGHFDAALLEEPENILDLCLSRNPEDDCLKWCKEFYVDEKAALKN